MTRPKPPKEMMDYIRRLQFGDSPEKRMANLDVLLRSMKPIAGNPMALPGMREFAEDCPDLLQQGQGMELTAEGIYTLPGLRPTLSQLMAAHYASAMAFWSLGSSDTYAEAPAPEPPTEPFETNMVEPLVGWRAWTLVQRKGAWRIASLNEAIPWPVDEPFEAKCRLDRVARHMEDVPRSTCSCGIYATDAREGVPDGHGIMGTIYGWGRYVRGEMGWRTQYAYPKEFFLASDATPEVISVLRQYHVPIHVDVPTNIYDPREDGYENEYREAETHGHCGAHQEPDAQEDQDADDDA